LIHFYKSFQISISKDTSYRMVCCGLH
jgi:hypothetical protein